MKKKKTILEEGTIRRFMRLANLNPLSENYFGEEEIHEEEEDEELAVDAVDAVDDAEAEEPDAEPMDMDAEEAPAEEPAVPLEVATDIVAKVGDALGDALNIPVEVTSGAAEEADPEGVGAELELDAELPAPEMEEPDEDAPAAPYEEAVESEEEVVSEDEGPQTITNEELVSYISQRVAQRLAEKKKA
jgi:hypothetical protein